MSVLKLCAGMLLAVALPLSVQAEAPQAPTRGPGMMGPGSHGMSPGMMAPGMGAPRPFAGVQFSDEQRQKIQEMMARERDTHQQRVATMQKLQQQLQQLYMAEKWDAKAITAVYEKMHAAQRETIAAMAEARNKVYDLLTQEQREQMMQFQQRQMQRYAPRQRPPMPQQ